MVNYDYVSGKKRVEDILDNRLIVIKQNKVPSDNDFTFENGYYGWITGLFVDIRDSSSLFLNENKENISKIIRSLTSETIEILRNDNNLREIGIRGDCVYAIYTTPTKDDIYEIANKSFYINTYMEMLNQLLGERNYNTVSVGIGVSTAQELVVKAGRRGVGVNNKVWIGDAVAKASRLSSLGSKEGLKTIVYSRCCYNNFIDHLVKENGEKAKTWFNVHHSYEYGTYYDAGIIKTDFYNWINSGMKI